VAYTDPEVAWVGLTEEDAKRQGIKVGKAVFPWAASGRAIANGRDEGFTKLLFDEETHRCVGGGIVGTHAGDMIGEVALAIEMGADPVDIGRTIHRHGRRGVRGRLHRSAASKEALNTALLATGPGLLQGGGAVRASFPATRIVDITWLPRDRIRKWNG
jgi:hypothetical protein